MYRTRSRRRTALVVVVALLASIAGALSVAPIDAEAQTLDVYGPRPFAEIVDSTMPATGVPTAIDAVENRRHVMLLDAATKSNALAIDDASTANLTVASVSTITGGSGTYGDALRSMFQMLDKNAEVQADVPLSGTYSLHPELLSYHAIDADASAAAATATGLLVRDRGSFYLQDQATIAYLVFTIVNPQTPESTAIRASSRLHYVDGAFETDTSWSPNQWLTMAAGGVGLTATEADATAFYIADATEVIDMSLDAGSDFNPTSIDWQTNSFAAFPGGEWDYFDSRLTNELLRDLDPFYHDQLGDSAAAEAAAQAALDAIEATLAASGESLRYDKSVYLAYRDNALQHTFAAQDVYNARLGERTVAHVYFVNASDDSGVRHPFMVVASHDASGGPNFLIDVPRPPGDGTPGTMYEDQTITRRAILENKLVKIPLKDYGLVDNLADNDLAALGIATLASDESVPENQWNTLNHTGTASIGIAVDGVVIYPASNNTLALATSVAEVTSTGIHVGRGLGLHYHADGHGYTGNGLNLYNLDDYSGRTHPPLLGFAYDGVALFGKYEDGIAMDGSSVELDEYGGHDHGLYGYHYHAHAAPTQAMSPPPANTTIDYTQHFLLVGAWRGDVNNVPAFDEVGDNQLKSETAKRYVGGTAPAATPDAIGNYVALNPSRILDTRNATEGDFSTPWPAATTRAVKVTGVGGVPADDVVAVALNITTVTPTSDFSWLTVWPTGSVASTTAAHTFGIADYTSEIVNDLVISKVGTAGNVSIQNATGTVDLVIDVVGYYSSTASSGYMPLAPARILDSRNDTEGDFSTPWPAATTRAVTVVDTAGVPAVGVDAVVLNITTVSPTSPFSWLTVSPSGEVPGTTAAHNFGTADFTTEINNDLVIAKVGTGGSIDIRNESGTVDLVIDVVGYFASEAGHAYEALNPSRILDTRNGADGDYATPWTAGLRREVETGFAACVDAVVLHVTTVNPTSEFSWLTITPAGGSTSTTAAHNFGTAAFTTEINNDIVIAKTGTNGNIDIFNQSGDVDVVIDLVGVFGADDCNG